MHVGPKKVQDRPEACAHHDSAAGISNKTWSWPTLAYLLALAGECQKQKVINEQEHHSHMMRLLAESPKQIQNSK